jgi:hypothetical protein
MNVKMTIRWTALALSMLMMSLGSGCGDEAPPAQLPAGNVVDDNNPNPNPNNTPSTATLEYVSSPMTGVAANSRVDLTLRYVSATGSVLTSQPINWAIDGNGEGSSLDASQSTTDVNGQAKIQVLSSSREATFDVVATAANDPAVPALRFRVNVESKDFASYRVTVNYNGGRRYTNSNVKVSLFEVPENCSAFNPLRPGTAFRSEKRRPDAQGFPMNFTFTNLSNGTRYMAVAVAFAAESSTAEVIGSYGCNDSRPAISEGNNPDPIVIDMVDVLPDITGTWAITSRFNLGEALPENVRNILDPILDFFGDPAGTLVTLLTDVLQDEFGFDLGSVQTVLERIAEDLLQQAFGANETVSDILTGGADVSEVIRNFHLEGNLIIPSQTVAANGLVTGAELNYFNFGYRWRLNCESDEEFEMNPECGDAYIPFGDAGLNPINANWNGAITNNPNFDPNTGRTHFHELNINDHVVSFNYGEIVAFLIEKVALPLLFDSSIDSINALLRRFIVCEDIFDSGVLESICDVALDEASNALRNQLTQLSFADDNFTIGTPNDQPCALHEPGADEYGAPTPPDLSHNPKFKEMGKDETHPDHGDLRCLWNAQIQFSDDPSDVSNFSGRWFGEKRFDN